MKFNMILMLQRMKVNLRASNVNLLNSKYGQLIIATCAKIKFKMKENQICLL